MTNPDIPGANDYAEVAFLTDNYLRTYFEEIFAETEFTSLDKFLTVLVSGSAAFNEFIHVDYESTAYFNASESASIPTIDDLDVMLRQAFKEENLDEYLAQLSTLTSSIFSGTTNVEVVNTTRSRISDPEKQQAQTAILGSNQSGDTGVSIPAIVGISAGAMVVGALMLLLMRRLKRRTPQARFIKSMDGLLSPTVSGYDDPSQDESSWTDSRKTASHPLEGIYLSEVIPCIPEDDENDPKNLGARPQHERSPLFGDRFIVDDDCGEVHI